MTITAESLEEFFSSVAIAKLQVRVATLEMEADRLMQVHKRRYLMPVAVEVDYRRCKVEISTWRDILKLAKDILYLVGELKEIETRLK